MARVTWIGSYGDYEQIIEQDGFTFTKGEAVEVPDNHPRLSKFEGNPTFAVGDEPVDLTDDEGELEAVRVELETRGVEFAPNARLKSLRKKLQDATE